MAQRFVIHPTHAQPRLLAQAALILREGGVVATPTDASYVLACHLDNKEAVERMRAVRRLGDKHLLTLMCRDLSQLSTYARVDNRHYRFVREWTPGPYTFILPATKEVPRRLWHPSRRTIGIRVPASEVAAGLLKANGEPLLCTSLVLPGDDLALHEADEILERIGKLIDAVIDAGGQGFDHTTVVDLTGDEPVVVRAGLGTLGAAATSGR
ncbi:MAG: threonylcarbamoyl-AMP synthase [Burkholderiaceae bacterium]|nr:threonylcarbamoyl-AMP synthase [Burkholderiaceae bacterium]